MVRPPSRLRRLAAWLALAFVAAFAGGTAQARDPRRTPLCDPLPPPARLVRYLSVQVDDGLSPSFGLVLESSEGLPTRVFNLSAWRRDAPPEFDAAEPGRLHDAALYEREFAWAEAQWIAYRAARAAGSLGESEVWSRYSDEILPEDLAHRLCSPVHAAQDSIETGERIVLGVALNYAAHAAEAGGGDVLIFPKTAAPTGAYQTLYPPADAELLDYEVELGFVALQDIDLDALPTRGALQAKLAYFTANDVSDREPIIARKPLFGHSEGYTEGKSHPGFLPAGPWLVRGDRLGAFGEECTRPLELSLSVVEARGGTSLRQRADTGLMLADPYALLEQLRDQAHAQLESEGAPEIETWFAGSRWHFPIAKRLSESGRSRLVLPRGSIVATGTPAGVALGEPGLGLLAGALFTFRSPQQAFIEAQKANRSDEGYLGEGDTVVAEVAGLGVQRWRVRRQPSGARRAPRAPCDVAP